MRFKFLLFVIVLISSCANNPYEVEDALYQCMVNKYAEENVDLEQELESFESHLMEIAVLKSNDGIGYYKLFNDMVDPKKFYKIRAKNYDRLGTIHLSELYSKDCLFNMDSTIIKSSLSFQLDTELQKVYSQKTLFTADDVRKLTNEIITIEEYNVPFYKMRVLLGVYYLCTTTTSIPVDLPKTKNVNTCFDCENLTFNLDSLGILSVDSDVINTSEMEFILKDFIFSNAPKYTIYLKIDNLTLMEDAFEIISITKSIISDLENEKSIEIYHKSYVDLDDLQKQEIKNYYPNTIQLKYN